MNAEQLLKTLVDADGVFSCPRPGEFESNIISTVFLKTVGQLVVAWEHDYIQIGIVVEPRTEMVYLKESVYFSKDRFGHLTWWKNAHRDLKTQVALTKAQSKIDHLASHLS